MHVDIDCECPDDPLRPMMEGGVTTRFGKRSSDYYGDRRGKKESRLGQMGDALKAWAEASKARSEASKAKTEALLARAER